MLLIPEGALKLAGPASRIVQSCDGTKTVPEIVNALLEQFPGADVAKVSAETIELYRTAGRPRRHRVRMTAGPQALIAEVTHRCPLHCVYCSNPEQMQSAVHELSTENWTEIIEQAAEIGCWHLHLTGGEPLLRRDAEQLVLAGREVRTVRQPDHFRLGA